MFEPYSFQTNLVNFSWTGISATSHYMLYGAEAVAYLVQRLYQSLSEEIAMALHFSYVPQSATKGEAENLIKE